MRYYDKNLIAITPSSVPTDDDVANDVNDQLRDNQTFMLTEFFHMDSAVYLTTN